MEIPNELVPTLLQVCQQTKMQLSVIGTLPEEQRMAIIMQSPEFSQVTKMLGVDNIEALMQNEMVKGLINQQIEQMQGVLGDLEKIIPILEK